MHRTSTLFPRIFVVLSLLAASTLIYGCGRFASVFYNQKNPQALQQDSITASGQSRTTIFFPENKANGIIKLAAVEPLGRMDSVTVEVPSELSSQGGTFETPRKLYAPAGSKIEVFAWQLGKPGDMAYRADGTIFVSDVEGGKINAISPAGKVSTVVDGLRYPYGLTLVDGALYYVDETKAFRFDFSSPTSVAGASTLLTDRVPRGGDFYTRTIRYSKADENFYISVSATNAVGEENDKEHATVFRMKKEGGRPVRASFGGLRNTVGMDFHPATGDLWGVDQGLDDLSEWLAPDEVNIIKIGKNYGHPYFYSQNYRNPKFEEVSEIRLPKNPVSPIIELWPYSETTDLKFYSGDAMGADWKNAALLVMRGYVTGSIARAQEARTGFKVVRLRADEDGSNPRQADFISGWLNGKKEYWGRPSTITIAPNGKTFYVSDYENGVVYKVTAP